MNKEKDLYYEKDMNNSPYIKVFKDIYNISEEKQNKNISLEEIVEAPKSAVIAVKEDKYEIVGEVVNPRSIARESDFVKRIKVFFSSGSSVFMLCFISLLMIVPMALLLYGIYNVKASTSLIAISMGKNFIVSLTANNIYSILSVLLLIQIIWLAVLFVKSIVSAKASRRYKFSGIAALTALNSILFLVGFVLAKGNGIVDHLQIEVLGTVNFSQFSMFLSIGLTIGCVLLLLFAASPYIIAFIAEDDLAANYIIKNKKRKIIVEREKDNFEYTKRKFSYAVSLIMSLALTVVSVVFLVTLKSDKSMEFINIFSKGTFAIEMTKNFNNSVITALLIIGIVFNAYLFFKTIISAYSKKRLVNSVFIAILQILICAVVIGLILLKDILKYSFYLDSVIPSVIILAINIIYILSSLSVYKKRV